LKSKTLCITALTLLTAMSVPLQLAAQDNQDHKHKHHHYQLIDLGTLGGPSSYFNSLSVTDVFQFPTVFYNIAQVRNKHGVFVGFADTSAPDPFPGFCYVPDCFVAHAFQWRNGVKTDLGTLPGGASSAAFWINAKEWITGNSENGETDPLMPGLPEVRAVLWKHGEINDLGTLGGSHSFAQAINDRGQITGLALNGNPDPYSYYYRFLYGFPNGTETHAFLWDEEEGMQDLGTLGGPDAFPSLINRRGQVAGYSYTSSIPDPNVGLPPFHPFLWEKGKGMKDLGSFGGVQTASVNGLNERGEVVGGLLLPGDKLNHPFLWDGKKLIDLTTPPFEESLNGEARWINETGEVVGSAALNIPCAGLGPQSHAFMWRNGVMTDLGMIAGTPNSQADFINAKRQIVGGSFACDTSILDAFLWENGSMVDLNTLISPNSTFQLYWAPFIDDEGVIGAFGSLANGDSHTVLLIPCDENHPGVEGCDYSLVDAAAATRRSLGAQRPTDHRPFPITGSEDDQKAPTSRESNWRIEDKLTIFDRAEPATDSGSKTSGDGAQSPQSCIRLGRRCYGPGPTRCCPAPFPHHSFCSSRTGWGACVMN
jgi:probable HAF family extracellular repeat protein